MFLLDLQELSGGTSLVITIIQICLLSSIITLVKFLQDAAQFNIYRRLDVKELFFIIVLLWRAKFSRAPIKEQTR